jgi:DNA adenine methylase
MPDRREAAIAHARRILAANEGARPHGTEVEKTIWGSPAGKKRLADRLVAMLPAHKTYVEPFAGSAAVLFAKEPAEVEVINDADLEIADAYRLIKKLSPEGLAKLKKLPWVGDEKTFKRLLDVEPEDDVERLHRFLYLTHFSYGKMRGKSFSPTVVGVEATTIKRIEKFAPRLKRVKVYGGDYEKVVRKYDSKDTVFFLDPPYPGYNVDVGESEFDEERFFKLLKSLKGRFLITYGIRGKFPELVKDSDFWTKRIRTRRSIAHMRGVGGSSVLTQLLVANYEPTTKALDDELSSTRGTAHSTTALTTSRRRSPSARSAARSTTRSASSRSSRRTRPTSSPSRARRRCCTRRTRATRRSSPTSTTTWCSSTAASRR